MRPSSALRCALAVPLLLVVAACARTARPQPQGAAPAAAASPASAEAPLTQEALATVRRRAMYIVDAERAAIAATDLLLAMPERDDSRLGVFLTVPRGEHWYALFGKVDAAGGFVPGYAFRALRATPDRMEPLRLAELPGDFSAEARAVRAATSRTLEVHGRRQLNPVVYLEEGALTVYVMQGSSERGIFLFGGDFRFTFSPDGRELREELALHASILRVDMRGQEGEIEASYHTHVRVAGPVETEWATLMLYPQLKGLYVAGPDARWMYALAPDGSVRVIDAEAKEAVEPR